MLAKITRGNQVTIPKEIVEKARLKDASLYVEVGYQHGIIFIKPVVVEERIAPEQYAKFEAWAAKREMGDLAFKTMGEGIKHLKKKHR
jgi:bifunctional DNA-binding transcriptional regulator/antitoxin component of YhaV-PrlF toxin-antitoxin module